MGKKHKSKKHHKKGNDAGEGKPCFEQNLEFYCGSRTFVHSRDMLNIELENLNTTSSHFQRNPKG